MCNPATALAVIKEARRAHQEDVLYWRDNEIVETPPDNWGQLSATTRRWYVETAALFSDFEVNVDENGCIYGPL